MKKIICCLFSIMIFFSSFTYATTTLYQKETESKISSGTTLKNYKLLTDAGWLNINILEVDLEDKYTNLGLLTASNGAGKLENVLSMAQKANAIAAINGDFFSASNGNGHSIGLSINNSEIISSFAKENLEKNTFASFLLNEDNKVFFEYLTNEITLTSKKTKESINISVINKFSENYATPALYTSDWGEYSLGSSETLLLTEMVVKNNKVTEIRYNEPAIEIPKNGFVISTLGEGAEFIKNNFKKGTRVTLETSLVPDFEDIKFAISGGAKLLVDGEIPNNFSHNITGKNPRTALGTDKKDEFLYLITVDGRQSSSIGMTQLELAEFLKDIGIYNAINLDGGGSTTMVAKESGNFSLATINNPSSGYLRSVINGIGIFSSAPNSRKLYGLNLVVEDTNIFKGEEREIKVTGYNKYYNPVEIDFEDIQWSYEGVELTIENGKISGNTIGRSILKASVGKISTELEINILSDANELFISPKQSSILPGEKIKYTVQAKNKNGYYAKTGLDTITTKIEEFYLDGIKQNYIPSDATFNNFTFTATSSGTYILSFSKDLVTSYALVNVTTPKPILLDNFERESFKFDEYPDEVIGMATLSTEQVYSGKTSVKLEYDFNQDIQIRGAYIELNTPLTIPNHALSLSFWVYNDSYKDEKLKIKLKDSNGSTKLIVLENAISHEGWKEINYDLSSISLPATISDIYVAQDDLAIKNSGCIYVDNLVYYSNTLVDTTTNTEKNIRIPNDIKLEDSTNKKQPEQDTFKIALLDTILEPNLMIEYLRNNVLLRKINNTADLTILTQETNETLLEKITTDKIVAKNYDLIELENSTIITMDISNNSLRLTDASQWQNFQYDIKDSNKNNIFIILNRPLDDFEDIEERKVFIDTLCELNRELDKNIFVLHSGYYTDYSMERGVKFLGINTKNISKENIAKDFSYILISVTETNASYEIKKIF